ncbi:ankyrin repeat domain-containing protein [Actimicrobium sp. CCC2.4]|uniref:ankyrin repeat domain-containing protein n=1 Tax=Actimicrobium sp. CCC2.4 TaxID=3048606 RepID=UPI002AC93228|nr:ankyrin repeat domain-containing protein [Actimicrobium sp. CCC2.4]MEB0137202.1 ankyrin repeat domain-containing protein [Actimicrobium sp. CCC2.4]WPX32499.1 ankyrin repeat domain-containing protein [Actimicrobium sp. CCC2.4]
MDAITNRIRQYRQQSSNQSSSGAAEPLLPTTPSGQGTLAAHTGGGLRNRLQNLIAGRTSRITNLLSTYGLATPALRRFSDQDVSALTGALGILAPPPQSARATTQHILNACAIGSANQFSAVVTLIRHKVIDPNRIGTARTSLLCHLAAHGAQDASERGIPLTERIFLLVVHGASLYQLNHRRRLPLEVAWSRPDSDGIAAGLALIAAGFTPLIRDSAGKTILHRAAAQNNLPLLRAWCQSRLATNLRDDYGQTPLMDAAEQNRSESIEVLLGRRGTELNATDRDGMTALHLATASASVAAAGMLLRHGADPFSQTGMTITPFEVAGILATQYREPQMLNLMSQYQ